MVRGCILNKDVLHSKMRRRIENPRIVLLDCPLEYKKLENQASMEFSNEDDFKRALEIEEQTVKQMCEDILKFKPDLIITEKGCSGAEHALLLLLRCLPPVPTRPRATWEFLDPPFTTHGEKRSRLTMRLDHATDLLQILLNTILCAPE